MSDVRVQIIRNSRLKLGEAPRRFDAKQSQYLQVKRPMMTLGKSEGKKSAYESHPTLLEKGHVVWGVLVVASTDLFEAGQGDGRGVAIFSPEIHLHDDLSRLAEMADNIEQQREHGERDPQLKRMYKKIHDNNLWFPPEPLPDSLSGGQQILISSFLCARKHMPLNMLIGNCFPVITHPKVKSIAMLPEMFWPDELRGSWVK